MGVTSGTGTIHGTAMLGEQCLARCVATIQIGDDNRCIAIINNNKKEGHVQVV